MGEKRRHRSAAPYNPMTGERNPQGPPAVDMTRLAIMQIISSDDDYLTCRGLDPDVGKFFEGDVLVAKPWLLQKTPWDAREVTYPGDVVTHTYTTAEAREAAYDGGPTSQQTIEPPYFVGDLIVAAKPMTRIGETPGMPDPDDSPTVDELDRNIIIMTNGLSGDDLRHIAWMDTNAAGRRWTGSKGNRCRALIKTAMTSGDTTHTVDNVTPLNGSSPVDLSTDELTVYNIHTWDADDNAICKIEWNETLEQWEIYQVDCPA